MLQLPPPNAGDVSVRFVTEVPFAPYDISPEDRSATDRYLSVARANSVQVRALQHLDTFPSYRLSIYPCIQLDDN